jgi:hypothetical protein
MFSSVRANRTFLARAVRYLTAEAGIRQFLDIGTGLPSANNTREVAQAVAPESRVVYVDNDPIVLAHARALLARFFDGLDLLDPGVVPIQPWRSAAEGDTVAQAAMWGDVGRKASLGFQR